MASHLVVLAVLILFVVGWFALTYRVLGLLPGLWRRLGYPFGLWIVHLSERRNAHASRKQAAAAGKVRSLRKRRRNVRAHLHLTRAA